MSTGSHTLTFGAILALLVGSPALAQTSQTDSAGNDPMQQGQPSGENARTGDTQGTSQGQSDQGMSVVVLSAWERDPLYQGWRAENLLDTDVQGINGEELGEVEDILINADGTVDGIIVEGGGIWDIGDTHFRVAWDQVTIGPALEYVTIPMTEETVEDFSIFADWDDRTPVTRWRASNLIGDYASLTDVPAYGIVDDLIISRDGEIQAVVVTPDIGYGVTGPYAYPYHGYEPGLDTYELPYSRADITDWDPFDYDAMDTEIFD